MKGLLKKIVRKGLSNNILLPFIRGRRFIFTYHDISHPDKPFFSPHNSTPYSLFLRQLALIRKNFTLISLDEIVRPDLSPDKSYACITFDDGVKSVKDMASPVLEKWEIPFAVFVNRRAVSLNRLWISDMELEPDFREEMDRQYGSKDVPLIESLKASAAFNDSVPGFHMPRYEHSSVYMNAEDIRSLSQKGVTIGSHTCSHVVLSNTAREVQMTEIADNKAFLDDLLGQDTTHFAFPFGKKEHFTHETVEILKSAGHKYLYTSNPSSFGKAELQEPYLIPRIGVLDQDERSLCFHINRQIFKKIDI